MSFKATNLFTAAYLLAFCGAASAYTITGTVSDEQGKALEGASVSLLKEGKNATTDNQGKFTIHEDEQVDGIQGFSGSVGYISVNNGVLSYSQGSSAPVHVQIFNSLGYQVFKRPCRVPACST